MKNKEVNNKTQVPSYTNWKAIIGIGISVILVIAMVVGIAVEQLKPSLLMTIDGDKLTEKDLNYFVYKTEAQYNYMDALYRQFYGTGYWDQTNESGVPNSVTAKNELESNIKQYYVLYKEAIKNGFAINDEDKKTAADEVKEMREGLSLKQKGIKGMSKSSLTKAAQKFALAQRYKQKLIDDFDIDDAALKAQVKKADYKQYDVQYYSVPLGSYDKDGNPVKATDKEKEAAKAELERLAGLAKDQDFAKLLGDSKDEESATDDANKEEKKDEEEKSDSIASFTDSDSGKFTAGNSPFGEDNEKVITAMKNGEISNIIETDTAYYLVKMVNNDCQDAYNEACDNAVKTEENNQFSTKYEELSKNYTFEINYEKWDEINLGRAIA